MSLYSGCIGQVSSMCWIYHPIFLQQIFPGNVDPPFYMFRPAHWPGLPLFDGHSDFPAFFHQSPGFHKFFYHPKYLLLFLHERSSMMSPCSKPESSWGWHKILCHPLLSQRVTQDLVSPSEKRRKNFLFSTDRMQEKGSWKIRHSGNQLTVA